MRTKLKRLVLRVGSYTFCCCGCYGYDLAPPSFSSWISKYSPSSIVLYFMPINIKTCAALEHVTLFQALRLPWAALFRLPFSVVLTTLFLLSSEELAFILLVSHISTTHCRTGYQAHCKKSISWTNSWLKGGHHSLSQTCLPCKVIPPINYTDI